VTTRSASHQAEGVAVRMEAAGRSFGEVQALRDVTLDVEPATIVGIIGPSGAGKTTAVRLMTGGLAPTSGTVRVLGEDPRRFRRRTRERIGYLPQLFPLYDDLTVQENVGFMASLNGLLWPRRRRRVREVLGVVDLWDVRRRRASDLSGGMRRRLALATVLAHEPGLLFLDEPTAGIDPVLRSAIWDELHRLRDGGRTLLVTTQYVNEAEECDVVALISEGRLVAFAPPEELRHRALGGQAVEVETEQAFDGKVLTDAPEVRSIHQTGPRSFFAVVEDAGTATPEVVERVSALGGTVASAREYRPTFDDVFAALLSGTRHDVTNGDTATTKTGGTDDDAAPAESTEVAA
jgi:ABC-2 type transport system ATP-binding protein